MAITMNHHITKRVTRTGVYGIANREEKILLIQQRGGPYSGKFDFPGGGVEFGETPEQALRREFVEEVAMGFKSFILVDSLSATIDIPKIDEREACIFFQIGMIYHVKNLYLLENEAEAEFECHWIDPRDLIQDECSGLLWQYIKKHHTL